MADYHQIDDDDRRTEILKLQIQLNKEKHNQYLDWAAISVVGVLLFLGLVFVFVRLIADCEEGKHCIVDDASHGWAKTFITTVGGVAIGVLSKSVWHRQKEDGESRADTP